MGARPDQGCLIDLIYDAAVEPELWPRLLEQFADLIGGDGATLMWQNQLTGKGIGVTARLDPKLQELFFGHFATRNPLRPPPEYVRKAVRHFVPTVITDESRLPKSELMRTEFYNDLMRPFDFHSTVSVGLMAQGFDGGTVDVIRPERRGSFTDTDLQLCSRLQPHFIRAFELNRKLAGSRGVGEDLAHVLDLLPHGVFLIGDDGRVRYANRAAERLTSRGRGLAIVAGQLVAGSPEATSRLQALIGAAATPDSERRSGGAMALAAPSGGLPLSVTVAPARSENHSVFHSDPAVIVCVTDLEAQVSLSEQRLYDLFDLSRAEARVALALFDGLDPREVAERLGLSVYTVRGHLMRIFDKTGVHGQVELARLMMRAIGFGAEAVAV
jgi:DNA-binding CsgD family transcriptional regulator/PAS domain-containing protein